jgi:hypothetical protein
MNLAHSDSLSYFARKLAFFLSLRRALQWISVWFFVWGSVILVLRISGAHNEKLLLAGLLGCLPLALVAIFWEWTHRPQFNRVRASYDSLSALGGLIMAGEAADMSAWTSELPTPSLPEIRWQASRTMLVLAISGLFVATALLLPSRFAHLGQHANLQIGGTVDQLQAEVNVLNLEKIVDDKHAEDLQKQLSQLEKDSSGSDPDKTWEALDHIKESNSDAAKQAADEALAKTSTLTEAETLAKAMAQASDTGMSESTASSAAQNLASLLSSAKLENGVLSGKIPPELLANLNGLNKEQLEKLVNALQLKKGSLSSTMNKLSQLRMIDPALLAKLAAAGKCNNPTALADYLSHCTNGGAGADTLEMYLQYCQGGQGGGRGGPGAPMTWSGGSSEKDTKFQEHALPPSAPSSDTQLVGVSRAAPEVSKTDVVAEHGALASATASGGSAHTQVILPEHRAAVQKFFQRDTQ